MKDDEELEYFLLIPADRAPLLEDDEYILILNKGKIRRSVLLYYNHNKFGQHLRHFKKIIWN